MPTKTVFNPWKITRVIVKKCETYLLKKYNCLKQEAAILRSFRKFRPVLQNNACVQSMNKQLRGPEIQSLSYSTFYGAPRFSAVFTGTRQRYFPSYFSSQPHALIIMTCYLPSVYA